MSLGSTVECLREQINTEWQTGLNDLPPGEEEGWFSVGVTCSLSEIHRFHGKPTGCGLRSLGSILILPATQGAGQPQEALLGLSFGHDIPASSTSRGFKEASTMQEM